MALPTLPSYVAIRQLPLGLQLAWKKEQQSQRQEQLDLHAKYFREQSVRNQFYTEWTSRNSFEQSMAAYCEQKLVDDKTITLEQRRMRLRHMLEEEQKQLDAEQGFGLPPKCVVVKKAEPPFLSKDVRRKKKLQGLLKDNHESDHIELPQGVNPLQVQLSQKKQQEMHRFECETNRKENLEKIKHAEENGNLEESAKSQDLHKKMEALKLMEEEATHLKKKEEALQVKLWELEKLEAQRRKFEERHKQVEMRNFLIRQYRAQLRRRAQLVQEELESDHKILAALLKSEQEVRTEEEQKERVFADTAWMKSVIEEQLELEREREAELDFLQREEAQRVWDKREATWDREKKARELLMNEVLGGRRQQLELKMQENREAQLESLRKREELIQDLELEKELRCQKREQKECHRKYSGSSSAG